MIELIPVRLESGLVVWHTREQYRRLWKDVDGEAAAAMAAPIELETPWLPEPDEDYRPRNPAWQCMRCGHIRCNGECPDPSDRDEDEDV